MKRVILLGPLAPPDARRRLHALKRPGDLLIAVDAGLEAWRRRTGVLPDLAIGDWDGLKDLVGVKRARQAIMRIPYISLPEKKAASDLAYAIAWARIAGIPELTALGVTGGRPDHQVGVLLELARAAQDFTSVSAYGPDGEYHFLSHKRARAWSARLPKGTQVSIFALAGVAKKVTLSGFLYTLPEKRLAPGSRGLSNVTTGRSCRVSVQAGSLAVLLPAPVR